MVSNYDTLYQEWLQARRDKDYTKCDHIREEFERQHKLTIFAEGEMPIIDITVHRMRPSVWEIKYGDPEVGKIMREWESKVEKARKALR